MPTKKTSFRQGTNAIILCGALGFTGCSAGRPPTESLSTAELTVTRAADSGASQYAPLELRIAREKLDGAKRAMTAEEYDRARRLAEQAQVDAQFAETKAQAERARQNAEETRKSIEALRREAERTPTSY
ncbi:MAG: DUF4398 domain-containing protein [Candidatus Binatia bacterium]